MATHTVEVAIKGGSISVDKETVHMYTSDEVQWKSRGDERFRIEFNEKGPFDVPGLDHARAGGLNRPRDETNPGSYKYDVVDDASGNRLDPKIIIMPPPSGAEEGP